DTRCPRRPRRDLFFNEAWLRYLRVNECLAIQHGMRYRVQGLVQLRRDTLRGLGPRPRSRPPAYLCEAFLSFQFVHVAGERGRTRLSLRSRGLLEEQPERARQSAVSRSP